MTMVSSPFSFFKKVNGPAQPGLEMALHMNITDGAHLFIFLFCWKMFFLTSGVSMTQKYISAPS